MRQYKPHSVSATLPQSPQSHKSREALLIRMSISSPNLHIVLVQPEIPSNTGNIIRLCANCGASLHLIEPLSFELDDKRLRRAGLDYHEFADVKIWPSLGDYWLNHGDRRLVCVETSGALVHSDFAFGATDSLLFGSETRGLPSDVLDSEHVAAQIRLPMRVGRRSLNLSNAVAVVVYEAWRQLGYAGGV